MRKKLPLPQALGTALRKRREAKGESQEAQAAALRVHRTYYSQLERGVKDIRLSTLQRLADELGISLSELFKDIEELRK